MSESHRGDSEEYLLARAEAQMAEARSREQQAEAERSAFQLGWLETVRRLVRVANDPRVQEGLAALVRSVGTARTEWKPEDVARMEAAMERSRTLMDPHIVEVANVVLDEYGDVVSYEVV